jgi:hypothetical protein
MTIHDDIRAQINRIRPDLTVRKVRSIEFLVHKYSLKPCDTEQFKNSNVIRAWSGRGLIGDVFLLEYSSFIQLQTKGLSKNGVEVEISIGPNGDDFSEWSLHCTHRDSKNDRWLFDFDEGVKHITRRAAQIGYVYTLHSREPLLHILAAVAQTVTPKLAPTTYRKRKSAKR